VAEEHAVLERQRISRVLAVRGWLPGVQQPYVIAIGHREHMAEQLKEALVVRARRELTADLVDERGPDGRVPEPLDVTARAHAPDPVGGSASAVRGQQETS
jgi:hypothetical protein